MKCAIAIDLGGTHLRAALINRDGDVLDYQRVKTRAEQGQDAVIDRIADTARSVMDTPAADEVVGVAVTAPGPVDHRNGIVKSPPNLPGWDRVRLADRLHDRLHMPIHLGNDANLAALGEQRYGAGRGFSNMIYITVSTGVGGGIIVENQLVLGDQGLAGEIGHIPLVPDGPICGCGNRGHLESLSSGPSIARQARAALHRGIDSSLADVEDDLTAVDVSEAARAGDQLAGELMARAGFYLGLGLVTLLHLFNTERFVIGGGVSNAGDLLLDPARHAANKHLMKPYRNTYDVVLAELGDDVGLMGAAALAFEQASPGDVQ